MPSLRQQGPRSTARPARMVARARLPDNADAHALGAGARARLPDDADAYAPGPRGAAQQVRHRPLRLLIAVGGHRHEHAVRVRHARVPPRAPVPGASAGYAARGRFPARASVPRFPARARRRTGALRA